MLKYTFLCLTLVFATIAMAQSPDSRPDSRPDSHQPPPKGMLLLHLIHLADTNGDQVTTLEEWTTQLDQLEKNGKGSINDEVIRNFMEKNRPENGKPPRNHASPAPETQNQERPALDRLFLENEFSKLDKNSNGEVGHEDLPKPGVPKKRNSRRPR